MEVTRKQDLLAAVLIGTLATAGFGLALPAAAANLDGQVLGGGAPIANASVTLWQAGSGTPRPLAQARSGADGRFAVAAPGAPLAEGSLYLVARGGTPAAGKGGGDNPAISLMTVLGNKAPAKVTINEMTTIASVWTHNQFIDGGTAIKGQPLQLKIAAGNVPSFVDLPPAAGAARSRTRSTAARRRRWPISPRWPACWPVA
jgi:hypothetical protein